MLMNVRLHGRRVISTAACMVAVATVSALAAPGASPSRASADASVAQQPGGVNGQTVGGISCDAQEGQRIHIHQHLVILDGGKPVPIPQNVGQPVMKRCIYWVHTHTPDGIIHIEAPLNRSFTLNDFFTVWGQPLSKTQVAGVAVGKGRSMKVWVDGKPYAGNVREIPLLPHTDIVIEVGPPFPTPPRFTTWGTL